MNTSESGLYIYYVEGVGFLSGRVRKSRKKDVEKEFVYVFKGDERYTSVVSEELLYPLQNTVMSDINPFYSLGEIAFLLSFYPNNQLRIGSNHLAVQFVPDKSLKRDVGETINRDFFEEVISGQNKFLCFLQASPDTRNVAYFESFVENSLVTANAVRNIGSGEESSLLDQIEAIFNISDKFTGFNDGQNVNLTSSARLFSYIVNRVDGKVGAQIHSFYLDVDRLVYAGNPPYASFLLLRGIALRNPGLRMRSRLPPDLDQMRIFAGFTSPDDAESGSSAEDITEMQRREYSELNDDLELFDFSDDDLESLWNTVAAIILLREVIITDGIIELFNPEIFETDTRYGDKLILDVMDDIFELLGIQSADCFDHFGKHFRNQSQLNMLIQELYYSLWVFIQTKINIRITPRDARLESLGIVYFALLPSIELNQPIMKLKMPKDHSRDSNDRIKSQSEIHALHQGFLRYSILHRYIEKEIEFQREFIGRNGIQSMQNDPEMIRTLEEIETLFSDEYGDKSKKREAVGAFLDNQSYVMKDLFSEILLEDFEEDGSSFSSKCKAFITGSQSRVVINMRKLLERGDTTLAQRYKGETSKLKRILDNSEHYINLIITSKHSSLFSDNVNDTLMIQSRTEAYNELISLDMEYVLSQLEDIFSKGENTWESDSDDMLNVLGLSMSESTQRKNLLDESFEEVDKTVFSASHILEKCDESVFKGSKFYHTIRTTPLEGVPSFEINGNDSLYEIPTESELNDIRSMLSDEVVEDIQKYLSLDPKSALSLPNVAQFANMINNYIEIEFLGSGDRPMEVGADVILRRSLHCLEIISMRVVDKTALVEVSIEDEFKMWENRLRALRESSVLDSLLRLVFAGHIHLDILAKNSLSMDDAESNNGVEKERDMSLFTPEFVLELTAVTMRIIYRFTSTENPIGALNSCYLISRINFWPLALILRQYVNIISNREREHLSSVHIHISSMIMFIISNICSQRKSLSFLRKQVNDKNKRMLKVYRYFIDDIPLILAQCLATSIAIPTIAAMKNLTLIFGEVYAETGVIESLLRNCVSGSQNYVRDAVYAIIYMHYVLKSKSSLTLALIKHGMVQVFVILMLDSKKEISFHAIYLVLSLANGALCSKHKLIKSEVSKLLNEIDEKLAKKFFSGKSSGGNNVIETAYLELRHADAMNGEQLKEKLTIEYNARIAGNETT